MPEDHFLIRYESPLIQGKLVKEIERIEHIKGVDVFGGHLPKLNLVAKFDINGEKNKPYECIKKIKIIEQSILSIEGVTNVEYLGVPVSNYKNSGLGLKLI